MTQSDSLEMLRIADLKLGFNDAVNYRNRADKEFLNRVFVRTDALDKLCRPHVYFLIGEKGTGKTAHAVYVSNNRYRSIAGTVKYIGEAEYQKFVTLKKEKQLSLTDYGSIWKVIIYLLMSEKIKQDEKNWTSYFKFHYLQEAIDEFYQRAFSPEIVYAIKFAEEAKFSAELISTFANIAGDEAISMSFSEQRFQVNLMYIQRKFEDALQSVSLSNDHVLFIDGIDIRPSFITFEDYLECVKGLAEAVWRVNTEFFADRKSTSGKMRVVLLARPDIFDAIGLQNLSSKIRDNAVMLDWRTTYASYRGSSLFRLADKLLASQQESKLPEGVAWDYYFPYSPSNLWSGKPDASFIDFLRYSMYRPRDIVVMLGILQSIATNRDEQGKCFVEADIRNPEFTRDYSEYLLGEVKSQISFYHSAEDYELFVQFFAFLKGKASFSYEQYLSAYQNFEAFMDRNDLRKPHFFENADSFLQLLYELNVICYKERVENSSDIDFEWDSTLDWDTKSARDVNKGSNHEVFISWCFRERSFAKLSPKVKTHVRYSVHFGLAKALNLGKRFV